MLKIVIVAGGTGGHVFPAECISKQLVKEGYEIEFITDQRGRKFIKYRENNEFKITEQKIYNTSKIKLAYCILKNICINFYKFIKCRPVCVIGFGGYPSFAAVIVAQILGIKTIIHEQNAVIGRANILLARKAKMVLTAFDCVKGLCQNPKKVQCVGNPTRFDAIYGSVRRPNNSIFTILVFGGSQGTKLFADIVAPAICKIGNIRVFHQARQSDVETIKNMYANAEINAIVCPFFDNMQELYQSSDLVISRSGASTIFEIIGFKIPAILIPYSRSVNGDQVANANALGNSAIILNESDLNIEKVANTIQDLINHPSKLTEMSESMPPFYSNINAFIENVNHGI